MFDAPASLRDALLLVHPWRPPRPLCVFATEAQRTVVIGYANKKHFKVANWGNGVIQLPILILQVSLLLSGPAWPCGVLVSTMLTALCAAFSLYEIYSHHLEQLDTKEMLASFSPRPK